jgi:L-methionine (R)-S-oxide reductase
MGKNDTNYTELLAGLPHLISGDPAVTVMANAAALLNEYLADINWVGFYIDDGEKLILGPFQGKTACTPIAYDRGVLGHSYTEQSPVIVKDVNDFPGHIACDSASRSEIVVPVRAAGRIVCLLDIDSPITERFDEEDREALEKASEIIGRELEGGIMPR